jgi:hypothetical protein
LQRLLLSRISGLRFPICAVTKIVQQARCAGNLHSDSLNQCACYTSPMSGRSIASRTIPLSALAVVLCVLAFLFACEAKFAWYSPTNDASNQVSAAKALRVDAPALVTHGISSTDRALAQAAFSATAILIAFCAALIGSWQRRSALSSHSSDYLPSYLRSPIDFRPPPEQ